MSTPSHRHQHLWAFTLIELLVVIAVMAMILAFAAPTIGNMGAARRLVNGGNAMVNAVSYARQLAKTENRLTALVLISEELENEEISRLFTIIQQKADQSGWEQVAKWEAMPEGVVVDAELSNDFFTNLPTVQPALPQLKRGTTTYQVSDYVYQVFLPMGGLFTTSVQPPELSLRNFPKATAEDNYFNIIINPNTGTTVIRRP